MVKGARYVVNHYGPGGCDGVFFYLTEKLVNGDELRSDVIIWPDGKQAECGDPLLCGSCGRHLSDWKFFIVEPIQ